MTSRRPFASSPRSTRTLLLAAFIAMPPASGFAAPALASGSTPA